MDFRRPTLGCINDIKETRVPEKTQGLQLSSILGTNRNRESVEETRLPFHTWEENKN